MVSNKMTASKRIQWAKQWKATTESFVCLRTFIPKDCRSACSARHISLNGFLTFIVRTSLYHLKNVSNLQHIDGAHKKNSRFLSSAHFTQLNGAKANWKRFVGICIKWVMAWKRTDVEFGAWHDMELRWKYFEDSIVLSSFSRAVIAPQKCHELFQSNMHFFISGSVGNSALKREIVFFQIIGTKWKSISDKSWLVLDLEEDGYRCSDYPISHSVKDFTCMTSIKNNDNSERL